MDKLTEHIFVLEGAGKVKDWNGTYKEYREWKRAEEAQKRSLEQETKTTADNKTPKKKDNKLTYQQRKEFNRLENEIEKLEKKKKKLSEVFNQTDLTPEKIKETSIAISELDEKIAEKEMRWMELAELAD